MTFLARVRHRWSLTFGQSEANIFLTNVSVYGHVYSSRKQERRASHIPQQEHYIFFWPLMVFVSHMWAHTTVKWKFFRCEFEQSQIILEGFNFPYCILNHFVVAYMKLQTELCILTCCITKRWLSDSPTAKWREHSTNVTRHGPWHMNSTMNRIRD